MTTHKKFEKTDLRDLHTNNRSLIIGSLVATLIATTPYLFYLYESVPDEKIWNTFLFTYTSNYYDSALMATWTFMNKAIPLFLLFIWFFTCRHWWYHVLIIPIAMYVFQSIDVINDDVLIFDEYQIMYLIPIMAIVIPTIYLIRAKMFNRITSNSMQDLEDEFRIGKKTFKDFF